MDQCYELAFLWYIIEDKLALGVYILTYGGRQKKIMFTTRFPTLPAASPRTAVPARPISSRPPLSRPNISVRYLFLR